MKVKAIFEGVDSLGYEHGRQYHLVLSGEGKITIKKTNDTGVCVYDSIYAFFRNWSSVTFIKE